MACGADGHGPPPLTVTDVDAVPSGWESARDSIWARVEARLPVILAGSDATWSVTARSTDVYPLRVVVEVRGAAERDRAAYNLDVRASAGAVRVTIDLTDAGGRVLALAPGLRIPSELGALPAEGIAQLVDAVAAFLAESRSALLGVVDRGRA